VELARHDESVRQIAAVRKTGVDSLISDSPDLTAMSEVRTLFRFCPACGKRFHIKLVGKKLMNEEMEETSIKRDRGAIGAGNGAYGTFSTMPIVVVEENVPITVDVEEFQYAYKCKHCGHVWTEMHDEERRITSKK